MFQMKIDKLFQGLPNVFDIANDILIAGFDDLGRDHDEAVGEALEIFRKSSLKLNKEKHQMYLYSIPGRSLITGWLKSRPQKLKALMNMPPPQM